MVDQEQTTEQTTETTSTDSASSEQDQGSSTSTTDQSESLDLAGGVTTDDTQTDDQADTRTDEEKAAEAERAELFGAPAEGEDYVVEGLPEGMEIDKAALDAVAPVARKLGLSNKGLSEIASVYAAEVLPGVMQRTTEAIEQQVVAKRTEWEGEAREAIKSNGQDLKNAAGEVLSFDAKAEKEVMQTAAKAMDNLAPQGFREWLKETGLSQHPMMIAFAYQAGKSIAEDTELESAAPSTGRKSTMVERFYGPKA